MKLKSLLLIYLSILLLSFVSCLSPQTTQKVSKTINLQQNELFNLHFEELYDFPAISFTYPSDFPLESITAPFEQLGEYEQTMYLITPLASIQDGLTTKYLIGYRFSDVKALVYWKIQLDTNSGVLMRQYISETPLNYNFTSNLFGKQIFSSFYSTTAGFITGKTEEGISIFSQFEYTEEKGLTLTLVDNQFRGEHTAIQNPTSQNIYIIFVSQLNQANLSLYSPSQNQVINLDTQSIETAQNSQCLMNTPLSLLLYSLDQSFLMNFAINYSTMKLQIQKIITNINPKAYYSCQVVTQEDKLIVSLGYGSESVQFITLKRQLFVNSGQLQLVHSRQVQQQCQDVIVLIDKNHYVCNWDSNIININTSKIIFQMNSYPISPLEFIDNQFILYSVSSYFPTKLQNPSVLLSGQNQVYDFSVIASRSQFTLQIEVTIQTTQSMITTISADSALLSNTLTQVTEQVYSFPVESFITGSNLNPQIDSTEATGLENIRFEKFVNLETQQSFTNNQLKRVYHTDGFISSIMVNVTAKSQIYSFIAAATPNITSSDVSIFFSVNALNTDIGAMDNYGAFLPYSLLTSNSKNISVPFIVNNQLYYNQIPNIYCSDPIFNFASDPAYNILFVLCGAQLIKYEYSFVNNGSELINNAQILSTLTLSSNFAGYNKLICIAGNLFIYSDSQIACYNYLTNTMLLNSIEVPQLSTTQQVILFKDTFFIVILANPIQTISQYSYGDFQSSKPQFLRNLFIDKNYPLNPTLNFIPKRNAIEYLFISTQNANQYLVYRVQSQSSQSQLYSTISILNDRQNIPVISSDTICNLSQTVSCKQILTAPQISYQVGFSQEDLNSILQQSNSLTLLFENQQITFNIVIARNAATEYGIIYQNDQQIQNLKTAFQDSNVSLGTTFYLNDASFFNACILGWDSPFNGFDFNITNKMAVSGFNNNNVTVSFILYSLKVSVTQNQFTLGDLVTYSDSGINQECIVLEDKTSRLTINANTFNITLYTLCPKQYYTFNATFVQQPSGQFIQATLNLLEQIVYSNYQDLRDVKEIVQIDGILTLLKLTTPQGFQIVYNDEYQKYQVNRYSTVFLTPISYNIINSLKIQLAFLSNGLVKMSYTENGQTLTTILSLSELIAPFQFPINPNESIQTVLQFGDNSFMIQYTNSFMYEVSFNLNQQNQLSASSVKQYYYRNGIDRLDFVLKGDTYTLLMGQSTNSLLYYKNIVLLYSNVQESSNTLLIESSLSLSELKDTIITSAEFISENQITLYSSAGMSIIVDLFDQVKIVYNQRNSNNSQPYYIQTIDFDRLLNMGTQRINFPLPAVSSDIIKSSSLQMAFIYSNFLAIIIILFI